jgi:GNAT superfamily N-acetyltransferase
LTARRPVKDFLRVALKFFNRVFQVPRNRLLFGLKCRIKKENSAGKGRAMAVDIREVLTRKDLMTFIYLPEKIHARHSTWVHPIYKDEWVYFDRKKNKAFGYCDTVMLLAEKDGQVAGRVMGIINHRFNEHRGERTARFGSLDAYEDREVLRRLLRAVEEWARDRGMTRIVGPYGFSDQDPEGFLVEGFEHRATIATYCNFHWMPTYLEEEGYVKDIDWVVYKINVPTEPPEFYRRIYERAMRRGTFKVMEFRKRKEIKPWIRPVLSLMNECYMAESIYGFAPLEEREMDDLAKRYLPVLDPRFIKAVTKDDEVVAFIIGMPDLSEGIRKARGRLLPFGFIHVLRAARTTRQLDLLLGGIKERYRGQGLDVLMGVRMIMSAHEAGYRIIDTHHEMESNVKVRAEMERMGGTIYKRYRAFQKAL